jgi:hypothetical protein
MGFKDALTTSSNLKTHRCEAGGFFVSHLLPLAGCQSDGNRPIMTFAKKVIFEKVGQTCWFAATRGSASPTFSEITFGSHSRQAVYEHEK